MSSKFSLLASAMPTFTKKDTVEAKVDALADYQVQLLDYLRYTLSNLDEDNFNATGLKQIMDPVLLEVKDLSGKYTALSVTADGLKTTVEGYEDTVEGYAKEVSEFSQTVSGFSAKVESYEKDVEWYAGQVSSYEQTVAGFRTTVSSYESAVDGYAADVQGYKSQVSSFEQTATKIAATVSAVDDANGNVTAASIVAAINATSGSSMVKIEADHIKMTGTTTFLSAADVGENGSTVIDGGRIKSGTISGDRIEGGRIIGATLETEGSRYRKIIIDDESIDIGTGTLYNDGLGRVSIEDSLVTIISDGQEWTLTKNGWVKGLG